MACAAIMRRRRRCPVWVAGDLETIDATILDSVSFPRINRRSLDRMDRAIGQALERWRI